MPKAPKLNQIIAVEKGVKSRVYARLSAIYKEFQKTGLFVGQAKTYKRSEDEGEQFPTERQRVQRSARTMLEEIGILMTELFDVTARKDWANCQAKADVVVDGQVLLAQVPATYLLFLEKQLSDLKAELEKLPELDAAHDWTFDPNDGMYRTAPMLTTKTRKNPKVIVKYDATPEHPAQTELVYLDEPIGTWETVVFAGAVPATRKAQLQRRLVELTKAVKFAREEANSCEAPGELEVGRRLFDYLLAE